MEILFFLEPQLLVNDPNNCQVKIQAEKRNQGSCQLQSQGPTFKPNRLSNQPQLSNQP